MTTYTGKNHTFRDPNPISNDNMNAKFSTLNMTGTIRNTVTFGGGNYDFVNMSAKTDTVVVNPGIAHPYMTFVGASSTTETFHATRGGTIEFDNCGTVGGQAAQATINIDAGTNLGATNYNLAGLEVGPGNNLILDFVGAWNPRNLISIDPSYGITPKNWASHLSSDGHGGTLMTAPNLKIDFVNASIANIAKVHWF